MHADLSTLKESTLQQTDALDRFLAGVERRAFRMAEMATGNREDALDLVQEAMLGLVRSYAQRDDSEWAPLFHRILQSRIRDWYRRRRVRNRFRLWLRGGADEHDDAPDPIQNAADTGRPDTEQKVAQDAAMDRLQSALHSLPVRQQQAFMLRIWEGMDVAQTAFAMGCSEGSVKTHYSRAVHRLRELLEDHWP
jgi:RNA polymerase sigma-70 factor (ECF subfamily)